MGLAEGVGWNKPWPERGKKSPLKGIFAVVVLLDGVVMLYQVYWGSSA